MVDRNKNAQSKLMKCFHLLDHLHRAETRQSGRAYLLQHTYELSIDQFERFIKRATSFSTFNLLTQKEYLLLLCDLVEPANHLSSQVSTKKVIQCSLTFINSEKLGTIAADVIVLWLLVAHTHAWYKLVADCVCQLLMGLQSRVPIQQANNALTLGRIVHTMDLTLYDELCTTVVHDLVDELKESKNLSTVVENICNALSNVAKKLPRSFLEDHSQTLFETLAILLQNAHILELATSNHTVAILECLEVWTEYAICTETNKTCLSVLNSLLPFVLRVARSGRHPYVRRAALYTGRAIECWSCCTEVNPDPDNTYFPTPNVHRNSTQISNNERFIQPNADYTRTNYPAMTSDAQKYNDDTRYDDTTYDDITHTSNKNPVETLVHSPITTSNEALPDQRSCCTEESLAEQLTHGDNNRRLLSTQPTAKNFSWNLNANVVNSQAISDNINTADYDDPSPATLISDPVRLILFTAQKLKLFAADISSSKWTLSQELSPPWALQLAIECIQSKHIPSFSSDVLNVYCEAIAQAGLAIIDTSLHHDTSHEKSTEENDKKQVAVTETTHVLLQAITIVLDAFGQNKSKPNSQWMASVQQWLLECTGHDKPMQQESSTAKCAGRLLLRPIWSS